MDLIRIWTNYRGNEMRAGVVKGLPCRGTLLGGEGATGSDCFDAPQNALASLLARLGFWNLASHTEIRQSHVEFPCARALKTNGRSKFLSSLTGTCCPEGFQLPTHGE